jgi:uncharacterized protein
VGHVADSPPDRGNSPVVIGAVLVAVLAVVLGAGLVGRTVEPRQVVGAARVDPAAVAGPRGSAVPRTASLGDNPLLAADIAAVPVTCALPPFGRSNDGLTTYYTAVVGCLNDAWNPVLREANIPFRPPKLQVATDLPASACGGAPDTDAVAYYCGRDETIYMSTRRELADGGGRLPPTHLATLSHEYGHHVQLLSGMLATASQRTVTAGEHSPDGLELTRRIELQANCFAGVFLAAAGGHGPISRSLARQAEGDFHDAAAEPAAENTHGSPRNQGTWADRGFGSGRPADCNTWTAPPAAVS